MAARKATAADGELDFDALLSTVKLEDRKSGSKDRYLPADQVKQSVADAVKTMYETGKRLPLKTPTKAVFDQVHDQFASAAHHAGLTANVRSVYEKVDGEDDKLVGATITVTNKRTNKRSKTESDSGE